MAFVPGFGGNITELVLGKHPVLDGDKDPATLLENTWFRGAKLFPFPNRIRDGEYEHLGKRYQLPVNFPQQRHAIHGLVYDKPFSADGLRLSYASAGLEGYPFRFALTMEYLLDDGFECRTIIRNDDKVPIPVGDGWHPYFTLGWRVDDLWLRLPSSERIEIDDRSIPTGRRTEDSRFSKGSRIGIVDLDTGYFIGEKGIATTELRGRDLGLDVWQESGPRGYNYLQVFIHPDRRSIAIEPMTCNTDAFNNKEGLILLEPGEELVLRYGVRLA